MNLKEKYFERIKELNLKEDILQIKAINHLQNIFNKIHSKKSQRNRFYFNKTIYPSINGLYMWGGVGRGKTFIMDLFYNNLPIEKKNRQHFAHFMKNIHENLKKYKFKKNSLSKVAYDMAKEMQVICFDEFFVEDIADAMILGNVFSELFKLGVILVATSNIEPTSLYRNGLQRELFLPAIDVLLENVDVLNLDSGIDYRLSCSKVDSYINYLYPYNEYNRKTFFDIFFTRNTYFNRYSKIDILGRIIPTLVLSSRDVCFDFKIICGNGRSSQDYINICERFEQIFVYNLVGFDEYNEDMARRFISMIDEFYDQNKKVIILATSDFKYIYEGIRLKFEFQRTISRLNDMQNSKFGILNE